MLMSQITHGMSFKSFKLLVGGKAESLFHSVIKISDGFGTVYLHTVLLAYYSGMEHIFIG